MTWIVEIVTTGRAGRARASVLAALVAALVAAPAGAQGGDGVALLGAPLPITPALEALRAVAPLVADSVIAPEETKRSAWSRLVTGAQDAGVTVGVATDVDGSRSLRAPGAERGALRSLQKVSVTLELGALAGIPGATLFSEAHSWVGHNATDDLGDVHGFSNIDAEEFREVAELWYEQRLAGEALRLKVGRVDANTEFAFVENGGSFLNSAMGFSPTIFVLPTYPEATLSANLFLSTGDGYAGVGVYDGAPTVTAPGVGSDLLVLGEVGRHWSLGALAGRVGVGGFHHAGGFERLDGAVQRGATGWWLVADQALSGRLVGFLQLGSADGRVSEVTRHLGGGLAWSGALPGRDEDVLGLGASRVTLSREPALGYDERAEVATELFYELHLPLGVTLRPDVQYLRNVGAMRANGDAVVATVRASFER